MDGILLPAPISSLVPFSGGLSVLLETENKGISTVCSDSTSVAKLSKPQWLAAEKAGRKPVKPRCLIKSLRREQEAEHDQCNHINSSSSISCNPCYSWPQLRYSLHFECPQKFFFLSGGIFAQMHSEHLSTDLQLALEAEQPLGQRQT